MRMRACRDRRRGAGARPYGVIALVGLLAIVFLHGCARLGPTSEPDVDWQSMESIKTVMRDGQRATSDMRIELSDRRKELADANIARAQLEGMLRETERRLAEARRIIELQREELTAARVARDRLEQAGAQLHSRLRRLEKQLTKARRHEEKTAEIVPSSFPTAEFPTAASISPAAQPVMVAETMTGAPPVATEGDQITEDAARIIVVREGETLWRLAKRHRVDLEELRRMNGLSDDRIIAGWTLRVPISSRVTGIHASGFRRLGR